ncbi:MAG: SMP-30/gluconolactonase/LRE family protein [Candidatus Methylacidiphilales bacterium]|nr:SMP-30/gluconolactonase/LRE family protein [Candidatus Methylacidiphilales bacterium]
MKSLTAQVLRATPDVLGEGPVWHDGAFWWIDIESRKLQRLHPDGDYRSWDTGERVGCAIPAADGSWILGLENSLSQLHPATGTISVLAPLNKPPGDHRFNDGKCDPRGRLLVGTMSLAAPPMTSSFYRYVGGQALTELFSGIGTSNGLAWSADGASLYYIDSKTGRIDVCDYDLETGTPSNRRPLVQAAPTGRPDGMCIDAAGNLWSGHWGGWAVRCYHGRTGECLAEIPIPCANVTSCCFGGPDLAHLYITTASKGLTPEEHQAQPGAGRVFIAEPGVTGQPVPLFQEG